MLFDYCFEVEEMETIKINKTKQKKTNIKLYLVII